jgi:hypothetical protein
MLARTTNLIGGPFYFLLAVIFAVLGYALGLTGGYLLALLAQEAGWSNQVLTGALGGLCAGFWPAFLRREKRMILLGLAIPASCLTAALVMSFLQTPALTGAAMLDTVLFGTIVGGATAMIILMPVPAGAANEPE